MLKATILMLMVFNTYASNKYSLFYGDEATRFEHKPKYYKMGQPQAVASLIPYCIKDGEVLILLAREKDQKTWSGFGGKFVDDSSLIETLQRELHQETFGIESISKKHLESKNTIFVYFDKKDYREILYAFSKIPYLQESIFLSKIDLPLANSYKEKDDFKWFSFAQFKALNTSKEYVLRHDFKEDLFSENVLDAVEAMLFK